MTRRVWLPYAIAGLPLAGYAALMAFAWQAARQVGHWPHYGAPDPKDVWLIARHDHYGELMTFALVFGGPLAVLAVVAVGFFTLRAVAAARWKPDWRLTGRLASQIAVYATGLVLFLGEREKLWDWLID